MATESQLTGIAGVHLVCAELTLKGYIATMTSRNAEGIDVLATNTRGSKTASIQVKTSANKYYTRCWRMSEKQDNTFSKRLFYVFVDLNKGTEEKPDFYIIPSKFVADYIRKSHQRYLKTPGKRVKKHKDTSMRTFEILDDKLAKKFLNKWANLKLN